MVNFVSRLFLSLVLLVIISFVLMKCLPGGAFDEERTLNAQVQALWEEQYGLNQNIAVQISRYFSSIAKGKFGFSSVNPDEEVSQVVISRFVITSQIAAWTALCSLLLSFLFFILFSKKLGRLLAQAMMAIPFVVWAAFILFLSSRFMPLSFDFNFKSYLLCIFILAIPFSFRLFMLAQQSHFLEEKKMYATYHRSLGFAESRIQNFWILKNALIPWSLYWIQGFGALLTGTVILESLYGIPGMGQLFVERLVARDTNTIVAILILFGFIVVVSQWVSEACMRFMDPRLREKA